MSRKKSSIEKKQIQTKLQINLKGEKVEVNVRPVSIKNLFFDEFNPRISMYRDSHVGALGLDKLNQDQIMFSLTNSPSYYDLKNSIFDNNGVMNPLWIYSIGDNNYCVIEGNTRLAVYKELNEENPNNINFKIINCYVLDQKIDEEVKDFIRLTAHLQHF